MFSPVAIATFRARAAIVELRHERRQDLRALALANFTIVWQAYKVARFGVHFTR